MLVLCCRVIYIAVPMFAESECAILVSYSGRWMVWIYQSLLRPLLCRFLCRLQGRLVVSTPIYSVPERPLL